MAAGGSTKVIVLSLFANLGIAVSKFAGYAFTSSASLLAEAVHSVADCVNQALLLLGAHRAKRPPDARHPLGYGREIFFWSFIVAILLFSMGGLFAIYEGVHKLKHPGEITNPGVAAGILLIGIVLETVSFVACLKEVRKNNPYPNLWVWMRSSTAAELLVIFLEDAAALAGLVMAIACLAIAWATGDSFYDAAGSIAIGVLLVVVAVLLAREIKALLLGEAPQGKDYEGEIARIVAETIPGGKLLRFIALQTGGDELMVSFKVSPGEVRDVLTLIGKINEAERRIKERFPEVRWQFAEPDREA